MATPETLAVVVKMVANALPNLHVGPISKLNFQSVEKILQLHLDVAQKQ
jgi:hypothetical protein